MRVVDQELSRIYIRNCEDEIWKRAPSLNAHGVYAWFVVMDVFSWKVPDSKLEWRVATFRSIGGSKVQVVPNIQSPLKKS